MWLGVDYYPEQWDISMIDKDLDNIIELGSNVIRIGEFAWHIMEKEGMLTGLLYETTALLTNRPAALPVQHY